MSLNSPNVSGTIGLKNVVIAELLTDTSSGHSYGEPQAVAGAIEATITPQTNDEVVIYTDDCENDVLYPDPELAVRIQLVDIPLSIQHMVLNNRIDDNGVLVRKAGDKPKYFAIGFKSQKSNGTHRFVWLYKCRAKQIVENYVTKQGVTISRQTGEIEWQAMRRTHDARYQVIADESENGFVGEDAFLESVYEPSVPAVVPCTGLTLEQGTLSFDDAHPKTIIYETTPEDTTDPVMWGTSNGMVATVSNGVVTPVANGTCTISATCGLYTALCTVTILFLYYDDGNGNITIADSITCVDDGNGNVTIAGDITCTDNQGNITITT
ncbi:MAG: hypothetical protein J6Y20_07120 [Lachnospiraceae bacterium]|nr:hypothetical protein [Lachnospiraceae bacterium]